MSGERQKDTERDRTMAVFSSLARRSPRGDEEPKKKLAIRGLFFFFAPRLRAPL